jgi:hypothetical protein
MPFSGYLVSRGEMNPVGSWVSQELGSLRAWFFGSLLGRQCMVVAHSLKSMVVIHYYCQRHESRDLADRWFGEIR